MEIAFDLCINVAMHLLLPFLFFFFFFILFFKIFSLFPSVVATPNKCVLLHVVVLFRFLLFIAARFPSNDHHHEMNQFAVQITTKGFRIICKSIKLEITCPVLFTFFGSLSVS